MFLYAKIRKNLHLQPLEGASKPIVGVKVPFDRRREGFNNKKIMGLRRRVAIFALEFQQKCKTEC